MQKIRHLPIYSNNGTASIHPEPGGGTSWWPSCLASSRVAKLPAEVLR